MESCAGLRSKTASQAEWSDLRDRHVDRLRYMNERDSQAIQSCLLLVRNESKDVQDWLRGEADKSIARLGQTSQEEQSGLLDFARLVKSGRNGG